MDTDTRLSDRAYRKVLQNVETQFEFIRYCLRTMSDAKQKAFFKMCMERESADWEKQKAIWADPKMQETLKKQGMDPALLAKHFSDPEQEKMMRSLLRERYDLKKVEKDKRQALEIWVGWSEVSINQSELLLIIAYFECFMKIVHETFLNAACDKVFASKFNGKKNVEFPVTEIFADGSASKFRRELIIKEVKWLDQQSIERRIEYFKEHFGFGFLVGRDATEAKRLMKKRNQISHEILVPPQKRLREDPLAPEDIEKLPIVTEEDVAISRRIFKSGPWECIRHGAKKYPGYFAW